MYILSVVGDFLLSQWLWGVTFGWSYTPINIVAMWIGIRMLLHSCSFRSFMISLSANAFSLLLYSILVVGIFVNVLSYWYIPGAYEVAYGPLKASIFYGIIHIILQSFFFWLMHKSYRLPIKRALLVVLISNACAIIMSYFYVIIVMKFLINKS